MSGGALLASDGFPISSLLWLPPGSRSEVTALQACESLTVHTLGTERLKPTRCRFRDDEVQLVLKDGSYRVTWDPVHRSPLVEGYKRIEFSVEVRNDRQDWRSDGRHTTYFSSVRLLSSSSLMRTVDETLCVTLNGTDEAQPPSDLQVGVWQAIGLMASGKSGADGKVCWPGGTFLPDDLMIAVEGNGEYRPSEIRFKRDVWETGTVAVRMEAEREYRCRLLDPEGWLTEHPISGVSVSLTGYSRYDDVFLPPFVPHHREFHVDESGGALSFYLYPSEMEPDSDQDDILHKYHVSSDSAYLDLKFRDGYEMTYVLSAQLLKRRCELHFPTPDTTGIKAKLQCPPGQRLNRFFSISLQLKTGPGIVDTEWWMHEISADEKRLAGQESWEFFWPVKPQVRYVIDYLPDSCFFESAYSVLDERGNRLVPTIPALCGPPAASVPAGVGHPEATVSNDSAEDKDQDDDCNDHSVPIFLRSSDYKSWKKPVNCDMRAWLYDLMRGNKELLAANPSRNSRE